MKRKFKTLITALAVCAVSAFAVMASGCMSVPEWLEQARCTHKWNDGEVTKAATCEDVGEKTVTCTLCGYEDIEYIPATGHTWQKVEEAAPTCTQVGNTDGVICVTCQEYFITPAEIPALGHIDVTDTGHAPTCTETGLTDGSHCGVCNEIFEAQEEVPATGHNVVTVAGKSATCTEAGLTDGEACTTCGVTLSAQEEIPMVACADEDGDGYCDMCNIIMPLAEGTYTEVAATVGETVAGNWYRIYMPEEAYSKSQILLSSKISYSNAETPGAIAIGYTSGPVMEGEEGTYGVTYDYLLSVIIKKNNSVTTMFDYGDYIDVYISAGTLVQEDMLVNSGDLISSEPVDETTTITAVNGTVYRLQVNEGGEVAQPDDVVHPAEGTYTEVAATVGEKVAGNWYRVYFEERNGTYYPGAYFGCEGLKFGFRTSTIVEPACVHLNATTIVEIPNTLVIIQECENDKGIYADFYFNIGSCTYPTPVGEQALNITEGTTITSIAGEVYRLQVNE